MTRKSRNQLPVFLRRVLARVGEFRLGSLNQAVGLDLGTSTTSMWLDGVGKVVDEPTVVAMQIKDNKVVAIGKYAERMLGRTPASIQALRPVQSGVIADPDTARAFVRLFLHEALGKRVMFRPLVICSVPSNATPLERSMTISVLRGAGAGVVGLIDEPLAAVIGAGVQIHEPSGTLVAHLGAGTTEVAAVSLGGVVTQRVIRIGSDQFKQDLIDWLLKEHGILAGQQTAEELRRFAGFPGSGESHETIEITARDNSTGTPKGVVLRRDQIHEALADRYAALLEVVQEVLRTIPPALVSDVLDKGLLLTGGVAKTAGAANFFTRNLNVPVTVVDHPDRAVLLGIAQIIQQKEEFEHLFEDN